MNGAHVSSGVLKIRVEVPDVGTRRTRTHGRHREVFSQKQSVECKGFICQDWQVTCNVLQSQSNPNTVDEGTEKKWASCELIPGQLEMCVL